MKSTRSEAMMAATQPVRAIVAAPALRLAVAVNVLAALVLGGGQLVAEAPPLRPVIWPGAVALALAYALPAVLAIVALVRRRPAALLAAGLVGLPLAFTAMSGASLILLLPAAGYLLGYATWAPRPRLGLAAVGLIAAIVVAGTGALVLPFSSPVGESGGWCFTWTQDADGQRVYGPRTRAPGAALGQGQGSGSAGPDGGQRGSSCVSDVVTPGEAVLGLAAAAVAVGASLLLPGRAGPRPLRRG
jgi:hypothetical protein